MRLDDPQIRALLDATVTVRVATVGADGRPNAAPFWFWSDGERIVLDTLENRTVANLRRDPRVQVLVDVGDTFAELRGAQIDGRAIVHAEDAAPPQVLAAIDRLREVHAAETETDVFAAYAARETRPLAYVEILPTRIAYWDLGAG